MNDFLRFASRVFPDFNDPVVPDSEGEFATRNSLAIGIAFPDLSPEILVRFGLNVRPLAIHPEITTVVIPESMGVALLVARTAERWKEIATVVEDPEAKRARQREFALFAIHIVPPPTMPDRDRRARLLDVSHVIFTAQCAGYPRVDEVPFDPAFEAVWGQIAAACVDQVLGQLGNPGDDQRALPEASRSSPTGRARSIQSEPFIPRDPQSLAFGLPEGFICIAVGDIEGSVQKLTLILDLIRANPATTFVFLGDLFDNISVSAPKGNFRCVELLEPFLDEYPRSKEPPDFRRVKFGVGEVRVGGGVQFLAGNAELDALRDLQQGYEEVSGVFCYGTDGHKYQKKFRIGQLHLLFRYFKSCRRELVHKFDATCVHFRHTAATKLFDGKFVQASPQHLIVCGHNRQFCRGQYWYMLDISKNKRDTRIGVTWVEDGALQVHSLAMPLLNPIPEWTKKQLPWNPS
jgi:hypothetical protein